MKETIREYLHFTLGERRGIFFLLVCIVLLLALPYVYAYFLPQQEYSYQDFEVEIQAWQSGLYDQDSLRQAQYDAQRAARYAKWDKEKKEKWKRKENSYEKWDKKDKQKQADKITLKPQPFNPNEASRAEWLSMGLPEKTVNTILNYRNKGGRFYDKEDMKKIYGFKADWYEQLAPYINIPKKKKKQYAKHEDEEAIAATIPQSYDATTPTFKQKEASHKEKVVVDINKGDEAALQQVHGIGPYYAKRIVKFRESLGGYSRLEQIGEIYGMPDTVYQKILPGLKLDNPTVAQININTATAKELKAHPYIKWKVANAIVKYREANGAYTAVEELDKNYAIPDDVLEKVKPYLTVE